MIIKQAKQEYEKKEFEKAEHLYTQYLLTNPDNAECYYQRGMCKLHQNKTRACLEDFIIAKKIEPNNPYRHSSIAFIYSKLNQTENAIASYQKAIELDPEDAIAMNNLGILEEKKGNVIQAKKLYKHADLSSGIMPPLNKEPKSKSDKSTDELTKIQIIKQVFTTQKGMKEFINFIFKTK